MSKVTIGEALSRRRLKRGKDPTGRDAYERGQHHVVKLSDEDCLLSYVDRSGSVCIIPCELVKGEWFHRGAMVCASPNFAIHRNLPRSFALNNEMMRVIQDRFNPVETEGSPPSDGKTDEEDSPQEGKESSSTPPAPAD